MESIDSYVQRKTKQMGTYRSSVKELKVLNRLKTCLITENNDFLISVNELFFVSMIFTFSFIPFKKLSDKTKLQQEERKTQVVSTVTC